MSDDASDSIDQAKPIEEIETNCGHKIADWNRIEIDGIELIMFWEHVYKPEDDCEGVRFYVAAWVCRDINPPGPDRYERLMEGKGYFDGIRHLHFGAVGEGGYMNYPKVETLLKVFEALKKLEDEQLPRHEDW